MPHEKTWTQFINRLDAHVWLKIFSYLEDPHVVRFLMIENFLIKILAPHDPKRDTQKVSQNYFLNRIMRDMQDVFKPLKFGTPLLRILFEHHVFLGQYLTQYRKNYSYKNRDFYDTYCLQRWSKVILEYIRVGPLEADEPPALTEYEQSARQEQMLLADIIKSLDIALKHPQESQRLYFIISMLPIAYHCFTQESEHNLYNQRLQPINAIQLCIQRALNTHDIQKLESALERARSFNTFAVDHHAIYHEIIYKIANLDNYQRIFFQNETNIYQNRRDTFAHGMHLFLHYALFSHIQRPFHFLSGSYVAHSIFFIIMAMGHVIFEVFRQHHYNTPASLFFYPSFFLPALYDSLFLPFSFFLYTLTCSTWRLGKYYWDGKQDNVARTLMTMIQILQKNGIMPPENIHALLVAHGSKPMPARFMHALTRNSATWFATTLPSLSASALEHADLEAEGLGIKKQN